MADSVTGFIFTAVLLVLLFAGYLAAAVGIAFGAKRLGGWLKKND